MPPGAHDGILKGESHGLLLSNTFLIWRGVRPFIDGRTDMYGDDFTNAYLRAERPDVPALEGLLDRWKVDWTLLNPQDPVAGVLDREPGWRRLYADRYAVVHVRRADGAR